MIGVTETRRKRGSRRRRKKFPILLGVIVCLLIFGSAYGFASGWWIPWLGGAGDGELVGSLGIKEKPEGFNVLLLGTDERDPDESCTRTDTIIVLNYNDEADRMSLLSIPRDTRVQLPGHGMDKINSANVYGGPELTAKTVSRLIGVPIEHYVLTNFYGFKGIVDALGGVTLNVEDDMYHREQAYGGEYAISLKKGVQRLDGDKALQYVRFRGDADGDITRTGRQLKFLQALGAETMQSKTLTKLHKLVPEVYGSVETNIGLSQLIKLARAFKNIDSVQIVTQTLPGHFLDTAQGSFWSVDQNQARRVATALFNEGKVVQEVVQRPTESIAGAPEKLDWEIMVSQNDTKDTKDNSSPAPGRNRDSTVNNGRQEAGQSLDLRQEDGEPAGGDFGDRRPDGAGDMETVEPKDGEAAAPQGLPAKGPDREADQGKGKADWGKFEVIIDIDRG